MSLKIDTLKIELLDFAWFVWTERHSDRDLWLKADALLRKEGKGLMLYTLANLMMFSVVYGCFFLAKKFNEGVFLLSFSGSLMSLMWIYTQFITVSGYKP